ncbi:hypothetical protein PV371_15770 [Streptomyces sp. TX20-6-3]|uniref:hypothetical protein n=1 Tax=Streptomyces sp. TX20-6-3 TaxID=3028705 RepID=UPI0029AE89B4|nr:hypothetical protein [Streptomyces sp. TX20-6-3]MDX2561108.1 hypothetical protein [Streptomyces sp. TX20-6-3]
MSNSLASAVLTTPDLAEAIRAVRTLLAVAEVHGAEVDFEAVIHSPDVLRRVREVLPDGLEWWALGEGAEGSAKAGDDPEACLPIRLFDWSRPLDRAEPFIDALADSPASVRWDLDAWPEVPEAGLEAVSQKYAYLTLTVNSRDLYQDEPSQDHTVHVHTSRGDDSGRVAWLAARIGSTPTGRAEIAPL